MFKKINNVYLDTVIVGSGLSALNFVETYSKNKKKVDVISPIDNLEITNKKNIKIGPLPPQMYNKKRQVLNYFEANNLINSKESKILGSLNFGGLSNYWGLQIDNYINLDNENLKAKTKNEIQKTFFYLLKKYNLIGKFTYKKKVYQNEFELPASLKKLLKYKNGQLKIHRPILAYGCKLKKKDLNTIDENRTKLTASNFFKKNKLRNKITFHNYYLEKIERQGKKFKLIFKKNKKEKFFIVNKVVLATGTIATTKLITDFLNINKQVKIYHHPRLIVAFLAKKIIDIDLKFTPSLLQIIGKLEKSTFSFDLRPGNKSIINSITDISILFYPLKFFLNIIKKRIIFSNIFLTSKNSYVYLKKDKDRFQLYPEKNDILKN